MAASRGSAPIAPAALADRGDQAALVVLAVRAGLADRVELAAQAAPVARVGLAARAGQVDQVGSVGQAVLAASAGRGELAVQDGPAAGKPLTVRRGVLAVALARRRGPPTVLLGGRTSAGREARPWAV
jgi:hypothetical protein